MTAILSGASTFLDFGAGGTAAPTATIVVPVGTTRLMVAPVMHSAALRTVTSMTYNGVSMAQVAGSRGTAAGTGGDSAEWWTLVSPASGSHTLAGVLSASARGGWMVTFVKGDTGIGATAGNGEMFTVLSPAPADTSLILFAGLAEDDTNTVAAGPFQNNAFQTKLSDGAGANSSNGFCSSMRGYPGIPAWFLGQQGQGSVSSAIEILS